MKLKVVKPKALPRVVSEARSDQLVVAVCSNRVTGACQKAEKAFQRVVAHWLSEARAAKQHAPPATVATVRRSSATVEENAGEQRGKKLDATTAAGEEKNHRTTSTACDAQETQQDDRHRASTLGAGALQRRNSAVKRYGRAAFLQAGKTKRKATSRMLAAAGAFWLLSWGSQHLFGSHLTGCEMDIQGLVTT